jgi:pyridoxal phosphate enzyme (YggS family)
MAGALSERLTAVEDRIAAACRRAGRERSAVRLVAVTKGMSAAVVREALDAGLRCFGENYVQEWAAKRDALASRADVEWHFIGRVQRNKAQAVAEAALVHSLADLRVAAALAEAGRRSGRPVRARVQVTLDAEPTKGGVAPAALADHLAELRALEGLRLEGLMAIPPPLAPDEVRLRFRELRALRDRQVDAAGLAELSMGMSGDFEVAIEEGATLVRVGTAIFGPRKGKT